MQPGQQASGRDRGVHKMCLVVQFIILRFFVLFFHEKTTRNERARMDEKTSLEMLMSFTKILQNEVEKQSHTYARRGRDPL